MKYLLLLVTGCIILFACNKSNNRNSGLIKGKLVRSLCVDPLVQILDSNYYHLAETWEDTNIYDSVVVREHVFTLDNPCDYSSRVIREGEEFYFSISGEAHQCVVCAMYVASPATRHSISVQ